MYQNSNHRNDNYTYTVPRKPKYFCDKLLTLDNKKTLYKWSCFKAKQPHYQTLVISYTHLSMRFEEIETCSWHVRRSLTTCLDRCLLWCIHPKRLLLLHPLTMTMWVLPKSKMLLEDLTWWKPVLQPLNLQFKNKITLRISLLCNTIAKVGDAELMIRGGGYFFLFYPRNCFEKRQSQSESNWICLGKWHPDALLFFSFIPN